MKHKFQDHFGVSRAEANGMLALLFLSLTALVIPQIVMWYDSQHTSVNHEQDIIRLERTLKQLEASQQSTEQKSIKLNQRRRISSQAVRFDINSADETQLRTISGIGPILSARIIKFRNRLGGFIRPNQYEEVYGLRPEVLQRFKQYAFIKPGFRPQRLNINTADIRSLAAHPYMSYQQARAIVRYREQHGPFDNLKGLEALLLVDRNTLDKVRPYLVAP